ncbi:MAG: hypothetical protein HOP35_11245 [Nitrospira sp.]|nr:hypothetical protein [Nitrospira sp.]
MNDRWPSILFGGGTWPWWYGVLFALFLAMMGTAYYACLDSSGPSGAPFLMFMLYAYAFLLLAVMSTVDIWLWARASGHGILMTGLFVLLAWIVIGLSWTFLFMATDPNYPEQLFTGRVLFTLHSILLYAGNLWMLWVLRTGRASSGATH